MPQSDIYVTHKQLISWGLTIIGLIVGLELFHHRGDSKPDFEKIRIQKKLDRLESLVDRLVYDMRVLADE